MAGRHLSFGATNKQIRTHKLWSQSKPALHLLTYFFIVAKHSLSLFRPVKVWRWSSLKTSKPALLICRYQRFCAKKDPQTPKRAYSLPCGRFCSPPTRLASKLVAATKTHTWKTSPKILATERAAAEKILRNRKAVPISWRRYARPSTAPWPTSSPPTSKPTAAAAKTWPPRVSKQKVRADLAT